ASSPIPPPWRPWAFGRNTPPFGDHSPSSTHIDEAKSSGQAIWCMACLPQADVQPRRRSQGLPFRFGGRIEEPRWRSDIEEGYGQRRITLRRVNRFPSGNPRFVGYGELHRTVVSAMRLYSCFVE